MHLRTHCPATQAQILEEARPPRATGHARGGAWSPLNSDLIAPVVRIAARGTSIEAPEQGGELCSWVCSPVPLKSTRIHRITTCS